MFGLGLVRLSDILEKSKGEVLTVEWDRSPDPRSR